MQVCTVLQTDNHDSTPPRNFLKAGCPSCHPTNSVVALKANWCILYTVLNFTITTTTTSNTTILWPLYRTACISRHRHLRTGRFCWSTHMTFTNRRLLTQVNLHNARSVTDKPRHRHSESEKYTHVSSSNADHFKIFSLAHWAINLL